MIKRIMVGMASCGIAAGANEVLNLLRDMAPDKDIVEVGCIGHCYAEPLVEVVTEEGSRIYERVQANEKFLKGILNLEDKSLFNPPKARSDKEQILVTALAGKI